MPNLRHLSAIRTPTIPYQNPADYLLTFISQLHTLGHGFPMVISLFHTPGDSFQTPSVQLQSWKMVSRHPSVYSRPWFPKKTISHSHPWERVSKPYQSAPLCWKMVSKHPSVYFTHLGSVSTLPSVHHTPLGDGFQTPSVHPTTPERWFQDLSPPWGWLPDTRPCCRLLTISFL